MPKFLETKLKEEYGKNSAIPFKVMNKIGAMRGNKETAKGREMEQKHMQHKDHSIREIRIEVHRAGKGGKVTGHTVHHHMVPKPAKKGDTGAFYEDTHHSYPFSADDHKGMMAHVTSALKGSAAPASEAHDEDEDDA